MSRSKAEILKDVRTALDMLERAKYGCALPGAGKLVPDGPVEPAFAIGWAKECLRRALELDRQTRCDGPTERERVEIIGHDDPVRNSDLGWKP